jgi:diguanylate cyclase (GGDEF)-like protein/PAS domain S-box-containing protein
VTSKILGCMLFCATTALHAQSVPEQVPSLHEPLRMLQLAAEAAILCAAGYIFWTLGRAAWKLRKQISFLSSIWTLGVALLAVCFWRMLIIARTAHLFYDKSPKYLVLTSVASVLVALGAALLAPLIRDMAQAGIHAAKEHDNFVALSENSGQGTCLMEAVYSPLNRLTDFRFRYMNSHAERLFHRRSEDVAGKLLTEVLPQVKQNGVLTMLKDVSTSGTAYEGELKDNTEEGTGMWVTLRAVKVDDGLALMLQDRTADFERTKRTEELNRLAQSLIQDAPFSIIAVSASGIITAMNSAAEQLTKYRRHELTGKHSVVVLHDNTELSERAFELSREMDTPVDTGFGTLKAIMGRRKSDESEWTYVCKDGTRTPVHLAMTVLRGPNEEVNGYLAVAFDISERKRLNDSISFMAHHDSLTKLPNRLLLNLRMKEAIEMARVLDQQVTLMMVDIDHFKRINDSLGHQAGDELLVAVSERLLAATRKTDTVSRVGGDEFVLLLPNSGTHEDTLRCVRRVLDKVQSPMMIAGREVTVTASIGVCVYPNWGADPVSLLRNADAAMYAAKDSGRNAYQLFTETMLEATADKLELETDMRHALERKELFLEYQPQVNCKSQKVVGIEALLRWNHPTRGRVAPGDFIPSAEESGLIVPIGQWVLEQACMEAREIQRRVGYRFTVAVNLSPRQFLQNDLADMVEKALENSGLPPEDLELEITEHTLMISSTETVHALVRLRELGVRIAIDDFGTGFSSFQYILEYQVDRLKIDRSFIAKCPHDANAVSIVRAVIAMAHGLRMKVVAEGVETQEQFEFLTRRRCDEAQGYLLGLPLGLEDVIDQLSDSVEDQDKNGSGSAVPVMAL